MRLSQYVVNAFASGPFSGNPAAVCLLERWLPDATLAAIASQNALSETAFFIAGEEAPLLRWFSPKTEVDLCGHATLAAGYVVLTHLRPDHDAVSFTTKSGNLSVARAAERLALDLPASPPTPVPSIEGLAAALGHEPTETLDSPHFHVAVLSHADDVRSLAPRLDLLGRLDRNVIVTARGDDDDFVSRVFAVPSGIPEDPVTGSAHCVLTPFWADRLGRTSLAARQLSARGGVLGCRLLGDRVELCGRCEPFLAGEISWPEDADPP